MIRRLIGSGAVDHVDMVQSQVPWPHGKCHLGIGHDIRGCDQAQARAPDSRRLMRQHPEGVRPFQARDGTVLRGRRVQGKRGGDSLGRVPELVSVVLMVRKLVGSVRRFIDQHDAVPDDFGAAEELLDNPDQPRIPQELAEVVRALLHAKDAAQRLRGSILVLKFAGLRCGEFLVEIALNLRRNAPQIVSREEAPYNLKTVLMVRLSDGLIVHSGSILVKARLHAYEEATVRLPLRLSRMGLVHVKSHSQTAADSFGLDNESATMIAFDPLHSPLNVVSKPRTARRMTEGAHAGSTPERLEKGSLRGRTGITRGRLWFVHLFIALTVCASLYPIATDMEHWPFSQYPMYSGLHAPTFVENELMGFNDQGEFPLDINRSMEPLTEIRLRGAY